MKTFCRGVFFFTLIWLAATGDAYSQRHSKRMSARQVHSSVNDQELSERGRRFQGITWREIGRSAPGNEPFFSNTTHVSVALLDVLLKCVQNNVCPAYEIIDDSTERTIPFDSIEVKMIRIQQKGLCTSVKRGVASIKDCAISFELMETWQILADNAAITQTIERLGPVVPSEGNEPGSYNALFYVDYEKCKSTLDSGRTVKPDGTGCTWAEYLEKLEYSNIITRTSKLEKMEFYAPDGKWRTKLIRRD